jgi:hypothetical protein
MPTSRVDLRLAGQWTLTLDRQNFLLIDDGLREKILVWS